MRAAELEMPALAITDRGGVYGAVRFLQACRKIGVKPIIGTALEVEGEEVVMIARDLNGYSNLCRLLSFAHADQPKGEARAPIAKVAEHRGDLFYLSATDDEKRLRGLQEALGKENVFSELHNHLCPEDQWVLEGRAAMAKRCGSAVVATNEVHYHMPERRRLHDVLVAIRHRATLESARQHLFPNAEHYLKSGADMQPHFKGHAEALATPWDIAQECDVNLDFRKVRFPGYPVPDGETPFSFLYKLCFEGVRERYRPITPEDARRLQRELEVIQKTGLAEFFLINWDLMRFARERGVPGQGRGSAADSIVAYVLGITRVDPIEHNLLFERFLHEEMTSTPDIDIDFSTEHREQVIQYIYDKYGWERTGMVCNVVTFQPRMAIRQVGKAMGFSAELLDRPPQGAVPRGRGRFNARRGAAARHAAAELAAVPGAVPRDHRVSTAPFDPQRRNAGYWRAAGRDLAGRAGAHGGPPRRPVQQGRRRGPGADQDGHARAADAVGGGGVPGVDERKDRHAPGPRPAAAERPGGFEDVRRGGHDRRLSDRVARADADSAADATRDLQRPGGRGGDHPAGPDPGQRGASLHPAQAGAGASHLRASAARADPQGHAGRDPLSGADHRDRDVRRGDGPRQGGWVPAGDDAPSQPSRDVVAGGGLHRRVPGQWRASRRGGHALHRGAGLRGLWLLPLTCCCFRPDLLRDGVAQAQPPCRVRLRPAQQPADGVLSPERPGRGPEASWGHVAAGRRQPLRRAMPTRTPVRKRISRECRLPRVWICRHTRERQ